MDRQDGMRRGAWGDHRGRRCGNCKEPQGISVIEGAGRKDELEIPEEVLREAIANAVIHREYGPRHVGQSVTVDIYPDRVEITNPGALGRQDSRQHSGRNLALQKCGAHAPNIRSQAAWRNRQAR